MELNKYVYGSYENRQIRLNVIEKHETLASSRALTNSLSTFIICGNQKMMSP